MATASDIISGALRKLGIRASETLISDSEMADGLEDLNDLGKTKRLFPAVASPSDNIRIPRGLDGALKLALAEKIMADYSDLMLTPQLQSSFNKAWDDIWRITNGNLDVKYPDTLPVGSSNQANYYLWNDAFFNQNNNLNF